MSLSSAPHPGQPEPEPAAPELSVTQLQQELASLRHDVLVLTGEVSRNHALLLGTERTVRRLVEARLSFAEQQRALLLMQLLRPHRVAGRTKVRVGSDNDGGYVLLDDWAEVAAVLSGGAGDNVDFEIQAASRGLAVHVYDHTVPHLPVVLSRVTHFVDALGPTGTTLAGAVGRGPTGGDLLLKLDIDGGEWSLLSERNVDLSRFRQIVIELHDLHRVDDPLFFEGAQAVLSLLHRTHRPVHVHPNNHGAYTVIAGVPLPDIVEVTWARTDAYEFHAERRADGEGVDRPNDPGRPEIVWPAPPGW